MFLFLIFLLFILQLPVLEEDFSDKVDEITELNNSSSLLNSDEIVSAGLPGLLSESSNSCTNSSKMSCKLSPYLRKKTQ